MNNQPMYRNLPCKLTDAEVESKSQELARQVRERIDLEREKKHVTSDLVGRIKARGEEIALLAREVSDRRELRSVACHEEPSGQMVETVRDDTGEVVATRMASDSERQGRLFYLPGLAAEAARGLTVPPGVDSVSVENNGKTVDKIGKKSKAEKQDQP